MLTSLHIRNYVLIDSLDVEFPDGLVIITGQTGAGKSIILGALSLLTGGRADASVISGGAQNCTVEAEFEISRESIRHILEDNDVEWDNGHLTVRRVVHSSGRTRSFINDCPVSVGTLSDVISRLIDIHSQHQSLLLTDREYQLSALDAFAGNGALLSACRTAWQNASALRAQLEQLRSRLEKLVSEREYNEAVYSQLDAAGLKEDELATLDEEQKMLANAEQIKGALVAAQTCFQPSSDDSLSLCAALKEVQKQLQHIEAYIPAASEIADRIESSRIELDDILSEIESLDAGVDVSPARLEEVESRQSLIYDLMRRHGCADEKELIALRQSLSEMLYDSETLEQQALDLEKSIRAAEEEYRAASARLHDSRANASGEFAAQIQESLHFLELENAVFEVALTRGPEGPAGGDAVTFLFDAAGKSPKDVAKCVSGGEMSRIMLCLKAMMARHEEMPTMIFDEIDTGVSGSVADRMGSVICDMGRDMQVFAITHLPQVAAKGNAHFIVSKSIGERTSSTMKKLSPEERVVEIARMLSGASITAEAVANARTLLGQMSSFIEKSLP